MTRVAFDQVGPGDLLVLGVRDSWAATRFALPRSRRRFLPRLEAKVGHPSEQRWFRLDVSLEGLQRLLALLTEKEIAYEVWR